MSIKYMSSDTNNTGQVLGASTGIGGLVLGASISVLPETGSFHILSNILSITASFLAAICLISFAGTRIIRKLS